MEDQVSIQVRFSMPSKYGEYQDALYFTEEEYKSLTQDDIDILKRTRRDNYVSTIDTKPAVVAPTKGELQVAKADLQAQIVELDAKIAAAH